MTTMLHRMAAAMLMSREAIDPADTWAGGPDDLPVVTVDGPVNFVELARAALVAVREADAAMIAAVAGQFDWGPTGYDDAPKGAANPEPFFTAMIDAILAEKPEGGV